MKNYGLDRLPKVQLDQEIIKFWDDEHTIFDIYMHLTSEFFRQYVPQCPLLLQAYSLPYMIVSEKVSLMFICFICGSRRVKKLLKNRKATRIRPG